MEDEEDYLEVKEATGENDYELLEEFNSCVA